MRVLAAVVLGCSLVGAGPGFALGVCVEGSYPPFSQRTAAGELVGFDVDIAEALCAEIGESCDFVQVRWEAIISALIDGRCDAIISSMSDTPARREQIDFTTRYYKAPVQFVGPADAGLSDAEEDLRGKVVGVQRDTVNQYYLQAHYPAVRAKLYGNQEHVLLDLTLGRLDAVLGETLQLDAGFLQTPAGEGFAFVGAGHFDPAIQGEGAAIGVRKGDTALRDRLSEAIGAIRADGRYQAIAGRYFDIDIYGD
jgi:polar amino acid transport system substrate-binding protein/arginine/ornithine transport system substrate-binding protein